MDLLFFGFCSIILGVLWIRSFKRERDIPIIRCYNGIISLIGGIVLILAGYFKIIAD